MDPYNMNLRTNASEAGILAGVEHFLRGLPVTVRDTLSAGEIADVVLNMIDGLRENYKKELEAEL